jgi:hypothetical protein
MAMNEDIFVRSAARARPQRPFRGAEARGPIIDQEGREIPVETLGSPFQGFRFDFDSSSANQFGNLTREQRMARLDALAKLLDVAFIVPGTKIRYGIDGLIGARSARLGMSRHACSAMSRWMAWLAWCRSPATRSTSCSAPTSATCGCCGAGWTSSRAEI